MPEYIYEMRIFLSLVNYDILLITKGGLSLQELVFVLLLARKNLYQCLTIDLLSSVKFCVYFNVQFCLLFFRIEILFVPPAYSNLRTEPRLRGFILSDNPSSPFKF